MDHQGYRIGDHRDVEDLPQQLAALSNAAFSQYEGAMPVDAAFISWYLRRPGCRPELCPVALSEDRLVSNVLVAIEDLRLGGEVLPCGIIDTVATLPQHRRHGLARVLMERAHELMRQAGAEAAVLYTNPDDHPYRFYQRLGYETRAVGAALLGPRPAHTQPAQPATSAEAAAIRRLLDRFYSQYEGYAPVTDELWDWHRLSRPGDMPVHLRVLRDDSQEVVGTAAFAEAETLVGGEQVPVAVAGDLACDTGTSLQRLLAAAPGERVMTLVDEQSPLYAELLGLGFEPAVRETAMVLPFSQRAVAALGHRSGPWYIMIESVVGV
jgi:predicted N-acetyltransferase YhbS